ncbi:hypothetical protein CVT24_005623 [Panaeolus cyanescens]|uniref:FAD-binding domain-containing protein n=1 Tax=Panaeolus cyanescens TaxID=181874 RepID=A0A409YXY2_9AGAR|nr:hypothetical protein CVT24_005623 [Panaeolus cyanescens]
MSGEFVGYTHRAGVVLKFLVVGGGLSGLASAYTLRKAGHEVTLLERTDGTWRNTGTGGLRSPPNMTNLLKQWGLGPSLEHISQECKKIDFCAGYSGEKVGTLLINDYFLQDLVAPFLFMQHGDLHSSLYDLARQAGVEFRFNSNIVGSEVERGVVHLADGTSLKGDIIVAADGYDSIFRPLIVGDSDSDDSDEDTSQEKHLLVRFTLPTELLVRDPELRPLTEDPSVWSFWFGSGYVIHANMLNARGSFTVTMIMDYTGSIGPEDQEWREHRGFDDFQLNFNDFEPRTKKLLNLANSFSSRVFITRPCLETLVCDSSRLVLVGEAAHPLLPGGHHCTSLALEGAQTLGCIFSRIQSRDEISRLVTAYDEIATPHANAVHSYDHQHQKLYKAPRGAVQAARDARFRSTLIQHEGEHMEEANFRELWGMELAIFAYDAADAVEDWWGQWGSVLMRNSNKQSILSNVEISVSNDKKESGVTV